MIASAIMDYLTLVKAKTVLLMTFCSVTAFIVASERINPVRLMLIAAATALGVGGSCAIHNFLDMDVDSIMERTKKRALPSGRIKPIKAIIVGVALLCLGLGLAFYLSPLTFALGLLACLDYLVVYTWIAKRRTPLNVILGSPAGGLPVLAGWSASEAHLTPLAFLLAALVMVWIPNHIWNVASFYSDDYKKAGIPMLSAVVNVKKAQVCTVSTVVLLFALTIYLYIAGYFGTAFLLASLPLGAFLLLGNMLTLTHSSRKKAYVMFKFSSPYLTVVFLSMIIDLTL